MSKQAYVRQEETRDEDEKDWRRPGRDVIACYNKIRILFVRLDGLDAEQQADPYAGASDWRVSMQNESLDHGVEHTWQEAETAVEQYERDECAILCFESFYQRYEGADVDEEVEYGEVDQRIGIQSRHCTKMCQH